MSELNTFLESVHELETQVQTGIMSDTQFYAKLSTMAKRKIPKQKREKTLQKYKRITMEQYNEYLELLDDSHSKF